MRRALLAVGLIGCHASRAAMPSNTTASRERPIEAVEDEVLHDLAAIDRRIALRARVAASEEDLQRVAMAAVLHEDPSVVVIHGHIDPFSFDARARGLEAVRRKLPAAAGVDAATPRARAKAEHLAWLVDEEAARLDEERSLPRSASALVRAVVDTWEAPTSKEDVAESDRWLARRLAEIRASFETPEGLDAVRARELDDALDALERIIGTPGFTSAMQELVRVRDALERIASIPAAKARPEGEQLARRLRAYLGVTAPTDAIAQELAQAEHVLRERAEAAVGRTKLDRDAIAGVAKRVFVFGACVDAIPGSRLRSIATSKEREPACHLRHLVANAEDPEAEALALVAMHDHVVVAEWALDVARGTTSLSETQARHRFFAPVGADTRARYERIALVRPVAALGAALTASILIEGDPKARAVKWSTVGDVPLARARGELAQ